LRFGGGLEQHLDRPVRRIVYRRKAWLIQDKPAKQRKMDQHRWCYQRVAAVFSLR